jgi:YHS domain-containing protein
MAAQTAPAPAAEPTNTKCPVSGEPVSAKRFRVVVKAKSYWVCCANCQKELKEHPEKYLNADGTPKNEKKS